MKFIDNYDFNQETNAVLPFFYNGQLISEVYEGELIYYVKKLQ